ncbi:SCO1/SenC-domain-containing protein [Dimargaris cristalligena]|uniref:SCO1/SenC-domain-containing protein n=1 Tax=Dimargaris cristalligena TaxID=215637 RepID=A0A4P9ZVN8_9FUNG|nr:SCO1/SenC-domain-containing protein [Dimargaris cristalligena]|eukprot:RKP36700.1 SCO1/SenC-domain-containing protein [Dimargaris cristalligena]
MFHSAPTKSAALPLHRLATPFSSGGAGQTRRAYSTTGPVHEGREKERSHLGPFSPTAALVFLLTGAGLYGYLRYEKERISQTKAQLKADEVAGKPRIGGPFTLIDQNGRSVTNQDFRGRFMLVYFGFTHCPDICPEELDKMGEVLDLLDQDATPDEAHNPVAPIFVTCDPQRDGVPEIREYVKEFHPRLVGLTGSFDAINQVARAYRVYFSKPPAAQPDEDYLVDHSIFFYLMDPRGEFVDAYGREREAEDVYKSIKKHMLEEAQNAPASASKA